MVMIYAILSSDGRCINRVLWDNDSDWQPPVGCRAVPDPDGLHQIWAEPERARDELGQFVADDLATPDNEAWVEQ